MPRWRFLLISEERWHYQRKFNNQNHAIYWKIRLQIYMILQHFVDACDRLWLMSADFERQNIYHVTKPQNSIILLIELEMPVVKSSVTCYHPHVRIWLNSSRGGGRVPLTLLPSPCLFSDNSSLRILHKNLIIQIYENARLRGIFTCIV